MPGRRRVRHPGLATIILLANVIDVRRLSRLNNIRVNLHHLTLGNYLSGDVVLLLARPRTGKRQRARLKLTDNKYKSITRNNRTRNVFNNTNNCPILDQSATNRLGRLLVRRKRPRLRKIDRTRTINLRRGVPRRPAISIRVLRANRVVLPLTPIVMFHHRTNEVNDQGVLRRLHLFLLDRRVNITSRTLFCHLETTSGGKLTLRVRQSNPRRLNNATTRPPKRPLVTSRKNELVVSTVTTRRFIHTLTKRRRLRLLHHRLERGVRHRTKKVDRKLIRMVLRL